MTIGDNSIGIFLTSTALLITTLILWVGLWERAIERYRLGTDCFAQHGEEVGKQFVAGLGVVWTYIAILFALAAFAIASWVSLKSASGRYIPLPAIGSLTTAFLMTVANVVVSLGSTAYKLLCAKPLTEPPFIMGKRWEKCLICCAAVLAVIGIGFISFSMVSVLCSYILLPVGIALLAVAVMCSVVSRWHDYSRLWTCIRWYLWEKRQINKKAK